MKFNPLPSAGIPCAFAFRKATVLAKQKSRFFLPLRAVWDPKGTRKLGRGGVFVSLSENKQIIQNKFKKALDLDTLSFKCLKYVFQLYTECCSTEKYCHLTTSSKFVFILGDFVQYRCVLFNLFNFLCMLHDQGKFYVMQPAYFHQALFHIIIRGND